ncbi:MAG: hypothetical protein ACI83P_000421 [Janthinobacterium sp.]|jgi:hypothetical protein
MLNCQHFTHLLSQPQESARTLQERISLKLQVMMCSGCRNLVQPMQALRQVARAYSKEYDDRADKFDALERGA